MTELSHGSMDSERMFLVLTSSCYGNECGSACQSLRSLATLLFPAELGLMSAKLASAQCPGHGTAHTLTLALAHAYGI